MVGKRTHPPIRRAADPGHRDRLQRDRQRARHARARRPGDQVLRRLALPVSSGRGSSVRPMLVRELVDGQEVDQVLLVRDQPAPRHARRRRAGRALAGRPHRHRRPPRCATAPPVLRAGHARCASPGASSRTRSAAAGSRCARCAPPPTASTTLDDLLDGPPRPLAGMESDLRELLATIQNPHLRALLDLVFGPTARDLAPVPRRAGRQALPPGLPARAARALAAASPRRSAPSPPPSRASTATSR